MLHIRRSNERGHFDHGWLETYHTFSFGEYHDPDFMGFRTLRVINEDYVNPGKGFSEHPHRDMEIITYIFSGELEHRDSMGNGEVIRPGEIQYMAAGKGVYHSEMNPSPRDAVHLMQIWILPNRKGLPPRYEKRRFPGIENNGELTLIASPSGEDNSIMINQDARLYAAKMKQGDEISYAPKAGRGLWLQLISGALTLGKDRLEQGDGAGIVDEEQIMLRSSEDTELLLFDLA